MCKVLSLLGLSGIRQWMINWYIFYQKLPLFDRLKLLIIKIKVFALQVETQKLNKNEK